MKEKKSKIEFGFKKPEKAYLRFWESIVYVLVTVNILMLIEMPTWK